MLVGNGLPQLPPARFTILKQHGPAAIIIPGNILLA